MMLNKDLPKKIPIFPLSNFIIFPKTTVPLNIFEPRYIQMVDDSMKGNRYIGLIQPKKTGDLKKPDLHKIGCVGKITSFNETEDGRYLIVLNGICRYETISEINSGKLYRECEVNFENFSNDLLKQKEQLKYSDLKQVFKDLKKLFVNQGYQINWKDLENQSVEQTINTLSMASPFTLEEKQILLETENLAERKNILEEILVTYTNYSFTNKTIQ
ncbi:LON peptidase substrate-binding domain-containing protein [Candidatus Pelagibacter sp.]|nr:LON peptidase substrate-binding domain-containing protein [Candidatus Pelagibacter sp.]